MSPDLPFAPPDDEVEAPPPLVSDAEAHALVYLHATIAPKVLFALSLGVVAGTSTVLSLYQMIRDGELATAPMVRLGIYGIGLIAAFAAGNAGFEALRVSDTRLERIPRALADEVVFWQVAAATTGLAWVAFCAGFATVASA